ncbi:hypothetical protein [Aciditerrimonas ferrireducens]|uniref:hypothetical protein n=1 Tax=Aciditerrimonas ferrireducens TaxID=667306 RepID=UPI0020053E01|nr:hypothetical protein [Aciditerrimonas ferrireducens]MCK4176347.1 hypothetical protein [Aciditerrimonas ferrireducens]
MLLPGEVWLAGVGVNSPAFGIVLALHVAAVLVGFGSVLVTGVQGARLARLPVGPLPAHLARFFATPRNWAARAVYLVPLLGAALVWLSDGRFAFDDPFVEMGGGLWVAAVLLSEALVLRGERRLARVLADEREPTPGPEVAREGRRMALGAAGVLVLVGAAAVIMGAHPG